ncbi:hypothetical protein [Streptomyces sp. MMG1533]|uniref:hypothetical protein n=1 Tax=Streptomyces sp. MMG1533 TaxID=1415546 RepID=UPI00131C4977|nr:hypothetical protein [Streptomyces sp. MMG1533]
MARRSATPAISSRSGRRRSGRPTTTAASATRAPQRATKLADFRVGVLAVDELPLTSTGKILKRELA